MTSFLDPSPVNVAIVFGENIAHSLTADETHLVIGEQHARLTPVKMGTSIDKRIERTAKQIKNLGEESVPENPKSLPEEKYCKYQSLKQRLSHLKCIKQMPGTSPAYEPYEKLSAIQVLYNEDVLEQKYDVTKLKGFHERWYDDVTGPTIDGNKIPAGKLVSAVHELLVEHDIQQVQVVPIFNRRTETGIPVLSPEWGEELDPATVDKLENAINNSSPNENSGGIL